MDKPNKRQNKKLQHEREIRGWSQARVAEKLGTTAKRISMWECGETKPDRYYQEKLCDLFGKNAIELGFVEQSDTTEVAIQHIDNSSTSTPEPKKTQAQLQSRMIPLPPQPHFAHPYPLQENFTGRVHERRMLTEWLFEDTHPILALVALGGMGKSSLAWAWLQQDILNPPESTSLDGILWWSFYEPEATFALFIDQALIYTSGGNAEPSSMNSIFVKSQALIALLQQRRILLVIDGFERALRAYASLLTAHQENDLQEDNIQSNFRACIDPHMGNFLRWLAAGSLSSKLLLTTRLFPQELDNLAGCRREELFALRTEDATAFIHAQGVHGTRAETDALCKAYGNHPLALRLLSGLIVNDPAYPGDASVASDYNPLTNLIQQSHHILSLAYDAVRQPLQQLLSRLAAYRSKVNFEMAKVISPFGVEKELKDGLRELVERGLLFFNREQRYYDLHPVVRQYAYVRLIHSEDVHARLAEYFWSKVGENLTVEVIEPLRKIRAFSIEPASTNRSLEERFENLAPIIELCYHLTRAKKSEKAFNIYYNHLASQLYHRLGAYQIVIELLQAFPLEDSRQQLENRKRSWLLDALAHAYSASGYPQRAVDLLRASINIDRELGDKESLAVALWNLAVQQQVLGKLAESEQSLQHCLAICNEIHDTFNTAKAHQYFALQRAYQGTFEEASQHLDIALALFEETDAIASESAAWAYQALSLLLAGEISPAVKAAQQALEQAEILHYERDIIRAEWILGLAYVRLASQETEPADETLQKAEQYLSEALHRCREIDMVDYEADLLLALARLYHAKHENLQAQKHAMEALAIANRSDFRVLRADIYNLLARLELENGNKEDAKQYAHAACHDSICDGSPFAYKVALEEARRLLDEANRALI